MLATISVSGCLVEFNDWPTRAGQGNGGASIGGANAGGSTPGTGGVTGTGGTSSGGSSGILSSGVNWLSIHDDWADPALFPNSALNISGSFRAYGDSCASLTWDPVNRCASGTLCTRGPSSNNWGIAIGFDFRNTGESGSPPNAKLTWNPQEVGAIGVAWRIHGSAGGLQVWVLDMDPSWQGLCTAVGCDIAGPPDGTPFPRLEDTLLFDNMVKDDWSGTGIKYSFDPALTLGLQFKLPAVNVGGESFDFCVDQLGIILP